jgi:hypothetical protein
MLSNFKKANPTNKTNHIKPYWLYRIITTQQLQGVPRLSAPISTVVDEHTGS